jgi:phosphoglycerate kinase
MKREISTAKSKSIFMLENLRFMPGEAANNPDFAGNLASLGDYYVNDAFAVAHRDNASVTAITKFLPSYAGFGLEAEITNLGKVMKKAKRPLVVILGGAKIDDKLGVIKFFRAKANWFLIGGALANTLLFLKGVKMGKSIYEKNASRDIERLLHYKNILLPEDFRTDDTAILDIGPKTERAFEEKIKSARTIIWNGPLGVIERDAFAHGTTAIAKALGTNTKAFSVVGGGETVTALKKFGVDSEASFISTGGGAMLDFLAGKKLPGIEALNKK